MAALVVMVLLQAVHSRAVVLVVTVAMPVLLDLLELLAMRELMAPLAMLAQAPA